jgi:diaminopimelate epimerase
VSASIVKAHAYGNDFLLVPATDVTGRDLPALARTVCDRHQGVGADGLIVYSPLPDRVRMRLYNADGSPSEISGNGVRCLAAYALERRLVRESPDPGLVRIETAAGLRTLELVDRAGGRWTFRAAMGAPGDVRRLELEAAGERVVVHALSVGNPQCIVFGPLDEARYRRLGPALERHPAFPDRTNVEFAEVQTPTRLRILIWERGVGPTEASGTGACGAAVAAMTSAGVNRDVEVESPGGVQRVEWRPDGVYLTGWAETLFEGRWLAEFA